MDINKIPRRERRFYRKIKKGKLVYSDKPVKTKTKKHQFSDTSKPTTNKEKININKETFSKITPPQKTKLIESLLQELSENLNPDVDTISEMIYEQLKRNNVDVDKRTIKEVVDKTDHYRASRKRSTKVDTNDPAQKIINDLSKDLPKSEVDSAESRKEQRERITLVVDNVYEQIEKKKIKDDFEDQKRKDAEIEEDEEFDSEIEENEIEDKKRKKEKKKKKEEPKKDDSILNIDMDEDDEESEDDLSDDEDDLGLKF
jgi:hypothetical protein